MGTRADFYVGRDLKAKWIGSIAWDGYRGGIPSNILNATNATEFRRAVQRFLKSRDDATFPEQGWPWPWNTSAISDCSYWYFSGHCWDANSAPGEYDTDGPDYYMPCDAREPKWGRRGADEDHQKKLWMKKYSLPEPIQYPDMSALKNVRLDQGSGIILLSVPR